MTEWQCECLLLKKWQCKPIYEKLQVFCVKVSAKVCKPPPQHTHKKPYSKTLKFGVFMKCSATNAQKAMKGGV